MKIELIIISYNSKNHFDDLFSSISKQSCTDEILITVVDNESSDGSIRYLKDNYPEVKIIDSGSNRGYGAAANLGASKSDAEILFICNSDIILYPDAIENATKDLIKNKNIGLVGGQQEFPNGDWQYSYGDLPGYPRALGNFYFYENFKAYFSRKNWKNKNYFTRKRVSYLDGAFLGVRKEVYSKLGGFDEDFYFYSEEADLCKRIKNAGYANFYNPKVRLVHLRGGSSRAIKKASKTAEMIVKARKLYCKKHCSLFERKFYYLSEIYFSVFNIILSFPQGNKEKRKYHLELIKWFLKR